MVTQSVRAMIFSYKRAFLPALERFPFFSASEYVASNARFYFLNIPQSR